MREQILEWAEHLPPPLAIFCIAMLPIFELRGAIPYAFTPLEGEAGVYSVCALHPDLLDRPVQRQFTLNRVSLNPTTVNVHIPRNVDQVVQITASAAKGTTANNLRLVYGDSEDRMRSGWTTARSRSSRCSRARVASPFASSSTAS